MSCHIITSTDSLAYDEWLDYRKRGIGGSDAAVVCGISRYKSPVELWMDKTGQLPCQEAGEAAYWGTQLEALVRAEFTKRTGIEVQIVKELLQSDEHPFMLANLDGVCQYPDLGTCIFEAKTASAYKAGEWEDTIPDEYMLQIQHYMAVTGLTKAYVVVLIGGNKMQWQVVNRDEETIQTLIALENHFWDFVVRDVPPSVDANSGDALALLYPTSTESSVVLPTEADELVAQWLEIKKAEDELKTAKATCENKLKALLKDAESGIAPNGYVVSWKSFSQSRLDSTKLKAAHADIATQFTTTVTGRKFSVSASKASKKK